MRKWWWWLGLILGVMSGAPASAMGQDGNALTVVLVRHAERASNPARDPVLSGPGRARTRALVRILESANVTAVYTTQFQRTRQTGQPVAERAGIDITVVPATGGEHIAEMTERIRSHGAGEVVLVAGHSNTIPPMVNALTGLHLEDLEEDQYDRLYIVMIPGDGPGSLITLRYGRASP